MEPEGSLPHSQKPITCSTLSQIDPVHTPHPTTWRSILILSSHLCLGLPLRCPPPKPCLQLYVIRPSHSSRFDHPNNSEWAEQIIKFLIMQFSPLPCHLVPPKPKYSPQHPILKQPQPTFLPHCERPSFTPKQNNRQYYTSICLNLYIFWLANWKTKDSAPNDSKQSQSYTLLCIYHLNLWDQQIHSI